MNIENLKKMFNHILINVSDDDFTMGCYFRGHNLSYHFSKKCNTVGDVIGHCVELNNFENVPKGKYGLIEFQLWAEQFTGIESLSRNYFFLFSGFWSYLVKDKIIEPKEERTQALLRLQYVIENGKAPDDYFANYNYKMPIRKLKAYELKKMNEIVILKTTQKASEGMIGYNDQILEIFSFFTAQEANTTGYDFYPVHLYEVSNEEIKTGDWILCLFKTPNLQYYVVEQAGKIINDVIYNKNDNLKILKKDCKKIVSTTNKNLSCFTLNGLIDVESEKDLENNVQIITNEEAVEIIKQHNHVVFTNQNYH